MTRPTPEQIAEIAEHKWDVLEVLALWGYVIVHPDAMRHLDRVTMTLHISGTGWHGIYTAQPEHLPDDYDVLGLLPAEITAALKPCPTCDGRGVIRRHIVKPHVSIRYADPCPDCHEGRPTITVTVPCDEPGCHLGQHWNQIAPDSMEPIGVCPGRVERRAVIREVLPVVKWEDVDIGLDYPVPCITTDPHGNSLLVSDRGPDDYYATHIDLHNAANHTHVAYIEVLA